ncbi:MAG: hypothetical protein QF367_10015 [Acidimicrobiales bacterium]|jgi:hypothetical protein|nr:hypothetical protein [Actinomycetes bacterium]MDP6105419.1 hypothetical protein [Acidimicrobiales bacterium]MCP4845691.1 hypothetical protein [Actinomycetes bacterium]MDP6240198.1 hypothetical protein [Acidimicrobiales bacterium]MDP7125578.1 hypothetical protein [Acidimicrobiales bacterium]|tara:strand:- start:8615 stop:8821 length:207 start_codon:yes stop_codon:yes gene_type:complete
MSDDRVTREDLEAEVRNTFGDAVGRADDARVPLLAVAVAAGAILLGVAYLVGRRIGRRSSTTVEIRRI